MSNRPQRQSERAEARRRARLAAQRRLDDESTDQDETAQAEPERRRSFLERLLPPAPPLPGRPPPLQGFSYDGRLRPVVERLWLLARSPLTWVAPGAVFSIGLLFSSQRTTIGFILSFATFLGPIAAGWFGWRRPGLYGGTAAFLGYAIAAGVALTFLANLGASIEDLGGTSAVLGSQLLPALLYTAMGYALGWYGGYLRRRQASAQAARRRR